ncbi:MAG: DsrE family protein [Gammaproteobacteria bacterium]|nr:DsrE family protein [Gammaproteobacteria bacterium]
MRSFSLAIVCFLLALSVSAQADTDPTITKILNAASPPDGVVFEIITDDDDGLEWAIPRTQQYIKQLHEKFPQLAIAVVTHGREMFALQKRDVYGYQDVHNQVQSLIQDENISLHACGTYAGWRGLASEDFPAYVDVTASGPATINDYVALGYVRVILEDED